MNERRAQDHLRRLVAAGNVCALVASDPDRFEPEMRAQAVRAWDTNLDALRRANQALEDRFNANWDAGKRLANEETANAEK